MYQLLVTIQFIGVILLLLEFGYIYQQKPSKQQSLILLFVFSALTNTVGYLFEMSCTMKETALMSVKFTYLGKVYIPLCMFIFILEYCEIKYFNWIIAVLFLFHTSLFLLVLQCENNTLFYKNIDFTDEGLFSHLVLTKGIFYHIFTLLIITYTIIMCSIIIYQYLHSKNEYKKRQLRDFFIIIVISITGFLVYLTGISKGYDITAICYVLSSSILLISIFRHKLFDTLSLAKDQIIESMSSGIIVLNEQNQIIYTNPPAMKLFPGLSSPNNQATLDLIFDWAKSSDSHFIDSEVYQCTINDLYAGNMYHGRMLVIDNITTTYNYTKKLESAVNEKTKKLEQIQHAVIESLANMIEARDGVTGEHVKRTSTYVEIITNALRDRGHYVDILTDAYSKALINAAPLHDIGKISIPDSILRKPGRLSDEEFAIIKQHATLGGQIIEQLLDEVGHEDYLLIARDTALYHHEKWDGSGYPYGLSGTHIPLCARIMAISDVYDALTSDRSYKKGVSSEKALAIITNDSGTHFDPIIVDTFLEVIDQIEAVTT